MTQTRSVTLKIINCLDCPHHKKVPSEIFDSWDQADEDVVCTLARGNHKYRHGLTKGRAVVIMERYDLRKHAKVPNWCPLPSG